MSTNYSQDWFDHNIPMWKSILAKYAGKPVKAIEIGSFEGRSTVWLMENILTHADSILDSVDPYLPYLEPQYNLTQEKMSEIEKRFYENTAPFKDKIRTHKELSSVYLKNRTEKADIIYIDGDHTSAGCLTDAVLSHELINSGGTIIFDDYLWDGIKSYSSVPKPAIDAFLNCYSEHYHLSLIGYQIAVLRK